VVTAAAIVPARVEAAWQALASVEDPELPALSIVDLGIVRSVTLESDGALNIGLTPTYSGCPATEVIHGSAKHALTAAGLAPFRLHTLLAPAWSSDWISAEGRGKLAAYGIVPPERNSDRPPACPRCASLETDCISEFGSTPCKALHRCRDCLEPFERFKCI
jgi:ring-1,2-phenylacetyl-CoA epoxidase subunit PaaD